MADEQRTNASQSIMLEEVIQDPMRFGFMVLKSNFSSMDRVTILHKPPKNYKENTSVMKAQGKQAMGFLSKHVTISAAPNVLVVHSIMTIKNLPPGESIKMQASACFTSSYIHTKYTHVTV